MDRELLRTFLAAAEAPTLTAAAASLHVTKSAVSQQMKALEVRIGFPLFERAGRSVRPTEAGRALAASLRVAFAAVDDAIDAARATHTDTGGEVRIGAPRPFTAAWLRPRIVRLVKENPRLTLDVSFGGPTELERRLVAREIDLAVMARAPEAESVEHEALFGETFLAVAAPRYLAERGTPRAPEDFTKHRVIVFDRDLPMHAAWWRAAFGSRTPLRGEIASRVASLDEMLALAEAGAGITVLPDYFVQRPLERGRLALVPAKRPAKNAIVLAWRRGAIATARFRTVRDALRGG
jgi:DNA-binding transcriptional LysR family regulator